MRVLIGIDATGTELAMPLPGWEVSYATPDRLADSLDGVDVLCPIMAPVDEAVLRAGRFGLVQQFGVGLDNVDVAAATASGVWVARLPADLTGNADSVAELAVLDVLTLIRRLDDTRAAIRAGQWSRPVANSLLGATVLLVGLGAVGTAVARRLAGFGVTLLGVRAHPDRGGPSGVAEVAGPDRLAEFLGRAEVVVCCAMYDAGHGPMFDAAAFGAMKPGAWFVNVARGGLVDEPALLAALDSGQVAGAGIDVFAVEPAAPDGPLVTHPRVIATPHIAGVTRMALGRGLALFAENLNRWAAGEPPRWAVNAPAHPRRPGVGS
jgi:phosphoglycerate dehydrogenase-like enzyme